MTVIPVFRSAIQIFTFNKIFNPRFDDNWRGQKATIHLFSYFAYQKIVLEQNVIKYRRAIKYLGDCIHA